MPVVRRWYAGGEVCLDGGLDGVIAIFAARELAPDLADAFCGKDVFILQ